MEQQLEEIEARVPQERYRGAEAEADLDDVTENEATQEAIVAAHQYRRARRRAIETPDTAEPIANVA